MAYSCFVIVKLNTGSLLDFREMSPQKKRMLALGGIVLIALLFASFLLSLNEDSERLKQGEDLNSAFSTNGSNSSQGEMNNGAQQGQNGQNGQTGVLRLPTAQQYDFNQNNQQQGPGLESLLQDNAPIGPNNDPFANMHGNRDEVNQSAPNYDNSEVLQAPLPSVAESKPAVAAPVNQKNTLYCDSFSTSQQAETQKAIMAFQGVVATIVQNQNGTYSLRIGPFANSDEARSVFYSLNKKGMVQKCALL